MMLITHKPFESNQNELKLVYIHDSLVGIRPLEVISVYCDEEELSKAYDILGRKPSKREGMNFIGVNAQEIVANW